MKKIKKIFTIKNKLKLQELFTSILLKAIEEKKENCNFNVVEDIRKAKKWISPYSCLQYLQGCVLNIPITTYDAKMLIYKHLGINKNTDFIYYDNDDQIIDREYWDLMGITLYRITQEKMR